MMRPDFQDKVDDLLRPYRVTCMALKALRWEIERILGVDIPRTASTGN
jgi:hypothetical protein